MGKDWEKFENKVKKLTNFKEKRGLFGPKKKAWAELEKKKKDFFGQKLGGKIEYKG